MQPTVVQLWFVVELMFFVFVLLELARPKCGSPHFNQITTSNRQRYSATGMVGTRNSISNWYSHKFLFTCDACIVLNNTLRA
jgi:hypothetical protein